MNSPIDPATRRWAGQGRRTGLARVLLLLTALNSLNVKASVSHLDLSATGKLHVPVKRQASSGQDFNWTSIQPSEDLTWTSCYTNFECARLSVPFDYSDPTGKQAAIALTKFPSKIPLGQEGYRGPILFNPGGPGGSGIQTILSLGEEFSTVLGDDYDLIGFDPRGVGYTTPGIFMFPSKPEGASFPGALNAAMNETIGSLGKIYATAQTFGNIAKARIQDVAEHVSSPVVARDMMTIVKAHGMDKLQYWGFSYGTVLGATFASMFPDNVGRIILDGVVDADTWYSGQYARDLIDTDKDLFEIYQACVDAGPSACPIHESSADTINRRINAFLDTLKVQPLSFYNETSGVYGTLDYSAAKGAIATVLYIPYDSGASLTQALAQAEQGVGQPLFDLSNRQSSSSDFVCDCAANPPTPFAAGADVTFAIACGDKTPPSNATLEDLRSLYETIALDSQFADTWDIFIGCSGWKISGKERFTGNFNTNNTNTSFPILFIGNIADPATPIHNAHKMSQGFADSVVLTQNSSGHCSVAATSACTSNVVREYFRDGKFPANGTVCDIESAIFRSS